MKVRARKVSGGNRSPKDRGAVVQGVSFCSKELLTKAKERAKSRRRSLSAHINDLVHDDLDRVTKEGA
jgi:hypothetical protein